MPTSYESPEDPRPAPGPLDRVVDLVVASLTGQVDEPYLLVLRGGFGTQYSGPFPDGLSALCALEETLRANATLPEDERVVAALAPLVPWSLARTFYDAP